MKILSVQTSCDETAAAISSARATKNMSPLRALARALLTQTQLHSEYGGVCPAMAKREHAKNLVPLLQSALEKRKRGTKDDNISR